MPLNLPFIPKVPDTRNLENSISGIWKNIKGIWGHLNVEIKHHDTTAAGNQTSVGTWSCLTDIEQGITGSTAYDIDRGYRDGDKLRVKTIQVKGRVEKWQSNATTDTSHILLFKHYENFSGVGPDINEVYDQFSNNLLPLRLRRPEFKAQYKLIAHKKIVVSGSEDVHNEKTFNIYVKPRKRVGTSVEWEGPGIDDISNGKYYIFDYSENGTNYINWSSRVTYVDN